MDRPDRGGKFSEMDNAKKAEAEIKRDLESRTPTDQKIQPRWSLLCMSNCQYVRFSKVYSIVFHPPDSFLSSSARYALQVPLPCHIKSIHMYTIALAYHVVNPQERDPQRRGRGVSMHHMIDGHEAHDATGQVAMSGVGSGPYPQRLLSGAQEY